MAFMRRVSAYQPLGEWLAACPEATVTLSFADLEEILGQPLPRPARQYPRWWYRWEDERRGPGAAWHAAGWRLVAVACQPDSVRFQRLSPLGAAGLPPTPVAGQRLRRAILLPPPGILTSSVAPPAPARGPARGERPMPEPARP